MTTTVRDRARALTGADPDLPRRPPVLCGVLAAGIVYLAGIVLCVGLAIIVWLASDAGSASGAMRVGAGFWLAGHGSGVTVGAVTLSVVPLGVPLLVVVAIAVAARRLAAESLHDGGVASLSVSAGACYGALMALTALLAGTSQVSFSAVRVGGLGFALAGVAALIGAVRVDDRLRDAWDSWPPFVRGVVGGCAAGVAGVFAAAAALVAYGIVSDLGRVQATFDELAPGSVGGVAIIVLCVLLLPNAVLLAASVLLGPGFAFGSGTEVSVLDVRLGELPLTPLTPALPDAGQQPAWVVAVMVVPLLAAAIGGVLAVRDLEGTSAYDAVLRGCTAGGCAGLIVGLVVLCAGGAIGPGRMGDVGAVMWCVPVAVLAMTVGGAAGAAIGHYRERRS
ncbi:MAG: DUF6350 family protein [Actinomycetia bacterium]|nr:DUF6350 family protein [Actinomycetes bacterium]